MLCSHLPDTFQFAYLCLTLVYLASIIFLLFPFWDVLLRCQWLFVEIYATLRLHNYLI